MASSFWLFLLCARLLLTESVTRQDGCVLQPQDVIWSKTGQEATLQCRVNKNCFTSAVQGKWFVFKEKSHFPVDVNTPRFTLSELSLNIKSTNANDSGIYYCAVVMNGGHNSGEQSVGMGTTLVVKDDIRKIVIRHDLLWASLAIVLICSLTIVTLIILKKQRYNSDTHKTTQKDKKKSTRKAAFREVLQEMYGKKKEHCNRNQRRAEVPAPHFNATADDTYENI